MPQIIVGDERWHYLRNRSGDSACLVMVHGSGGSHRHWPAEIACLEGMDVIVPDLPGHGKSTGRSRNRVEDYAAALTAFCERMTLSNVTVAGHSLGGAIALHLALTPPSWLERVVLVGAGCRLRVLPAILDGIRSETSKTAGRIAEMAFGSRADRKRVSAFAGELAAVDPEVTHDDFSACNAFDVCDRLHTIRIPALVVVGEQDRLTPEKYGRHLQEHIPNATISILPGVGHMMAMESPKRVAEVLQRYLRNPK